MQSLLLLLGAMLLQEPLSSTAAILNVRQHHIGAWVIHIIFLAATSVDIFLGYAVVRYAKKYQADSRLMRWAVLRSQKFMSSFGRNGERCAIIVFGPIFFPVSALFVPLLEFSALEIFWLQLIGESLFWYPFVWLPVLSAQRFAGNPLRAMYIAIVLSAIIGFGVQYALKKYSSKK